MEENCQRNRCWSPWVWREGQHYPTSALSCSHACLSKSPNQFNLFVGPRSRLRSMQWFKATRQYLFAFIAKTSMTFQILRGSSGSSSMVDMASVVTRTCACVLKSLVCLSGHVALSSPTTENIQYVPIALFP